MEILKKASDGESEKRGRAALGRGLPEPGSPGNRRIACEPRISAQKTNKNNTALPPLVPAA
jgi:hypothetical protein